MPRPSAAPHSRSNRGPRADAAFDPLCGCTVLAMATVSSSGAADGVATPGHSRIIWFAYGDALLTGDHVMAGRQRSSSRHGDMPRT